jgi:3,4-dihydroxy-2-butanone 4-phosphate synthase
MLAGLEPVAVLCEIVDDDGSMARLPRLRQFAQAENLKIISIADLIRFCLHTVENSLFSSISCQTLLHISKNH